MSDQPIAEDVGTLVLEDVRSAEPKSGWKTTEFGITITVVVAATVLRGFDKISDEMWGLAAGLNGGAYAIARGLAKRG